MRRLISWLLYLANARPPYSNRERFYAMKGRILRRWGRPDGEDWQVITKVCYGCDGTGKRQDDYWDDRRRTCRRCGGSGIFDRFWVRLERWEFAGREFHRPAERTYRQPVVPVAITGRVQHADHGRASDEAALWLALAFDRGLFWRLMTGGWPIGPTWRYPLVTLRKVTGRLGLLRGKFRRRSCSICGRPFRQGFRVWRVHSCICRRCDRAPREPVEEIPF